MYPYFQIAESISGYAGKSVFTDCLMLLNMEHPDTGQRYILAQKFPTLNACTHAYKELVLDAEYIVEAYLPRKNSKHPQRRWHKIPKSNAALTQ